MVMKKKAKEQEQKEDDLEASDLRRRPLDELKGTIDQGNLLIMSEVR